MRYFLYKERVFDTHAELCQYLNVNGILKEDIISILIKSPDQWHSTAFYLLYKCYPEEMNK